MGNKGTNIPSYNKRKGRTIVYLINYIKRVNNNEQCANYLLKSKTRESTYFPDLENVKQVAYTMEASGTLSAEVLSEATITATYAGLLFSADDTHNPTRQAGFF